MELAQNYFGDTRSGSLAGPVGGFLIASLAVVTGFLIRSMNARIRRLPESFTNRPVAHQETDSVAGGDDNHAQPDAPRP